MGERTVSLQVQAVLYNNDKTAMESAMNSIKNSIGVFEKRSGMKLKTVVAYGDASEKPIYSPEEAKELAEKYREAFTLSYRVFGFNAGYGRGNNLLAEAAETEYILIINPDLFLAPKFFLESFRLILDKEDVGLVEGRQTPLEHPKEYDKNTLQTDWSSGACMLMKKETFCGIGGFDTDTFFMYCEDVDLSWRIRISGKKLIYQPFAPVFHPKRIDKNGLMEHTDTELRYTSEAEILLAYKWSNNEHAEKALKRFEQSEEPLYNEAAKAFKKKRKEGKLPEQRELPKGIAKYEDGAFTKHRFKM